jgi:hypothetical protein
MSTNDLALPITVQAELDGWPVDLAFEIAPARLGAALARLGELGYTPRRPVAPAGNGKASKPKIDPVYQPDGTACCPVHLRPLKKGQYGYYCSAKDDGPGSKNGYCGLSFKD